MNSDPTEPFAVALEVALVPLLEPDKRLSRRDAGTPESASSLMWVSVLAQLEGGSPSNLGS